jgi:hypothetical protein
MIKPNMDVLVSIYSIYPTQIYLTARSLTSKFKVELIHQLDSFVARRFDSLGGDSGKLLLSVSQLSGDGKFPLSTNGHTVQTLVPTFDNFSST